MWYVMAIQVHTGQPPVQEINQHITYTQLATTPGSSLNNPRPESITHLYMYIQR